MPAGLDHSPGKNTVTVKVKKRASLSNSAPTGLDYDSSEKKNGATKVKKRASLNKSMPAGLDHSAEVENGTTEIKAERRASLGAPSRGISGARKVKKKAVNLHESMPANLDYYLSTRWDSGRFASSAKKGGNGKSTSTGLDSSPRKKVDTIKVKKKSLHDSAPTGLIGSPRKKSSEKRRPLKDANSMNYSSLPNLHVDLVDDNNQSSNTDAADSLGQPQLRSYNSIRSLPDQLDFSVGDNDGHPGRRTGKEDIDSCEHTRRSPTIHENSPSHSNGVLSGSISQQEDPSKRRANLGASRLSRDFSSSVPDRLGQSQGSISRERKQSRKRHSMPSRENASGSLVKADEEALLEVMPASQARDLYLPEAGRFDWNKWRNDQILDETQRPSKSKRRHTLGRMPATEQSQPKRRQSSSAPRRHSSRKVVETSMEVEQMVEEKVLVTPPQHRLRDRATNKETQQRSRRSLQTTKKEQSNDIGEPKQPVGRRGRP